jgi:hypothetical protein
MNDDDNPFLKLANAQMPKRRQPKQPMKLTPQEKEIADQQKLMRGYNAARKAEYKAHLAGPNAKGWRDLRNQLEYLCITNPGDFPRWIASQHWLMQGSLKTRQDALGLIAAHFIILRLKNGMSPIDDSLPGEEPTLFEIIRHQLRVLTP